MFMFYSWLEDFNDENKLLENQGYLIGSFIDPEAVRKILGKDGRTIEASEEDFEKLTKQLSMETSEKPKRKRKKSKN